MYRLHKKAAFSGFWLLMLVFFYMSYYPKRACNHRKKGRKVPGAYNQTEKNVLLQLLYVLAHQKEGKGTAFFPVVLMSLIFLAAASFCCCWPSRNSVNSVLVNSITFLLLGCKTALPKCFIENIIRHEMAKVYASFFGTFFFPFSFLFFLPFL